MEHSPLSYQLYPLGDSGLTIDFGNRIDPVVNKRVMMLFQEWSRQPLAPIKEMIPAYSSLTILYDPARIRKISGSPTAYEWMKTTVENTLRETIPDLSYTPPLHRIPVCYDKKLAPELETLAACLQLSVEELIHLHTEPLYRVYMLGFLPGFAYMGEVNQRIALPRKDSPVMVKAGSVGIAGQQTGIYPLDSPGGWCIVGQTPVTLFQPDKKIPVWLQAGDEVQFYPVTLSDFVNLKKEQASYN